MRGPFLGDNAQLYINGEPIGKVTYVNWNPMDEGMMLHHGRADFTISSRELADMRSPATTRPPDPKPESWAILGMIAVVARHCVSGANDKALKAIHEIYDSYGTDDRSMKSALQYRIDELAKKQSADYANEARSAKAAYEYQRQKVRDRDAAIERRKGDYHELNRVAVDRAQQISDLEKDRDDLEAENDTLRAKVAHLLADKVEAACQLTFWDYTAYHLAEPTKAIATCLVVVLGVLGTLLGFGWVLSTVSDWMGK